MCFCFVFSSPLFKEQKKIKITSRLPKSHSKVVGSGQKYRIECHQTRELVTYDFGSG